MRSEMRSAAMALVADRREMFESPRSDAQTKARLAEALRALGPPRSVRFTGEWKHEGEREVFEATFTSTGRARFFLKACSIGLALLFAASAWVIYSHEAATLEFLVLLFTVLSVLMFPLVATALGSARQAEESRILRTIHRALGADN